MPPSVSDISEPLAVEEVDAPVCDRTPSPSCGETSALSEAGAGSAKPTACDATDPTSSPSDLDSTCGESASASLHASINSTRKSVRFSIVHTREYEVEELEPDENDDIAGSYKTLGWEYTEKESGIDAHISESQQQRKEKYVRMIHDHIHRVEREHAEKEAEKLLKKKEKFRSRVLKPVWRAFLDAGSRSAMIIPTSPY
ncbi:hypothetical protein ACHAXT_006358 [Thalassiosira profunda]